MRRIGFVIFVAGVIVSSWYAARFVPAGAIHGSGPHGAVTSMDRLEAWGHLAGLPFGGGALLMIVGGVIARRAMAKSVHHEGQAEGVPASREDTHAMLLAISAAVAALPAGAPEQHADALRHDLDKLLDEMIPAFLEQQQRHLVHLGPGLFIEMNSAFASAERGLARAWSALTDEAWAEVPPCLETAKQAIGKAVELAA